MTGSFGYQKPSKNKTLGVVVLPNVYTRHFREHITIASGPGNVLLNLSKCMSRTMTENEAVAHPFDRPSFPYLCSCGGCPWDFQRPWRGSKPQLSLHRPGPVVERRGWSAGGRRHLVCWFHAEPFPRGCHPGERCWKT